MIVERSAIGSGAVSTLSWLVGGIADAGVALGSDVALRCCAKATGNADGACEFTDDRGDGTRDDRGEDDGRAISVAVADGEGGGSRLVFVVETVDDDPAGPS